MKICTDIGFGDVHTGLKNVGKKVLIRLGNLN